MTSAQQRAYDQYWPQHGLTSESGLINPLQLFGRKAPLIFEIGFGMGLSLAEMAEQHSDTDFIGVDVHKPGVGNLLNEIRKRQLGNIKIFAEDAQAVIERCLPDAGLARVQLYFPDPWPKRRHHKRRLVQPEFVSRILPKLALHGVLHMATDWEPYARQMLEVVNATPGLRNLSKSQDFAERPDFRPVTKFEKRGQRLGHGVWDLLFERCD